MAEILRYVDPDVVGGDGSGDSWINAYNSMNAFESAENTDLVTATDNMVVYCRSNSGTADTTSFTFGGWTTSTLYDVVWAADTGHEAVKTGIDTNRYRYAVTGDMFASIDYITIRGIQTIGLRMQFVSSAGLAFFDSVYMSGNGIRLTSSTATSDITIINSIIFDSAVTSIYVDEAITLTILNCIMTGEGIRDGASTTSVIKNTAVFNAGNDFNMIGSATIDYCASDDGDGSNPVAPASGNWANEFSNVAAGNFTLVTGGNCEGGGTNDPGSGLYSTDMDGDAYTSPWSIGVDAKTGAPPVGGIARSKIGMTLAGDGMTGRF